MCVCTSGFSGADCSTACPSLCSANGQCVNGKCICVPGFAGVDCGTALSCPRSLTDHPHLECAGHGVCDRPTQQCICRQGYVGKDCSIDDGSCGSQHCSNHGHCRSGVCECDIGFGGEHCEVKSSCPADCAGNGQCIGGTCHCYPGFSGVDCKTKDAPTCPGHNGGCNGNGVCSNGQCICSIGFAGESCLTIASVDSQPFCAAGEKCSGNGVCAHNQCFCKPGYFGRHCEQAGCAGGCGPMGFCSMGVCRCQPGWGGVGCNTKSECPNGCSGHGICDKGVCSCESYFDGPDCSKITLPSLACPKSNGRECGGVGFCFLGQCFCEPSFTGADCGTTVQNCPSNCGGPSRGTCRFGNCFCEPGYEGPGCEQTKSCPSGCEKHGICIKGECKCALGYVGIDCSFKKPRAARQSDVERDLLSSVVAASSTLTPPVPRAVCGTLGRPCSPHGLCVSGACVCEAGFVGPDCGLVLNGSPSATCPQGCSDHGECAFGTCVCEPGYSGRRCEKNTFLTCPDDCNSHGICHLGTCECHPGFEGKDCSLVKPCYEHGCERGACVQGVCECVWGFRGANCSEEIPVNELPEKDYLSTDGLHTCGTKGCGAHGVCMANQCVCVEGYGGVLCELPLVGWITRPDTDATPANSLVRDVYGTEPCILNCGLHGVCVGGSCSCIDGWAGDDCTISVPEVGSHKVYGASADFLSIMTLQKRARIASPTQHAIVVPAAKVALIQAAATTRIIQVDDSPIPKLNRNTAILSPSHQKQLAPNHAATHKQSTSHTHDARTINGADPSASSSYSSHVELVTSVGVGGNVTYSMSMNPWLMTFLCFLTGVLVTIALKCVIDKRDQEKRKMKKMEELLQPAS